MILLYYFLFLNFCGFLSIGADKQLARKQKRRISEKTLLSFILVGGTIGSGLAMYVFKHKTSKESFLLKFYGIFVLQVVIIFGLFYYKIIQL